MHIINNQNDWEETYLPSGIEVSPRTFAHWHQTQGVYLEPKHVPQQEEIVKVTKDSGDYGVASAAEVGQSTNTHNHGQTGNANFRPRMLQMIALIKDA